jgi:signal transduction histidine kinase/ActR/RegA family two-component response regulator/multisubunit Na+/H+ antiporter MnhC subunit
MTALGDLIILAASLFVATLFWAARQNMGRAVVGTRLISVGLFTLSAAAAFDAAELVPGIETELLEHVGIAGYTLACAFLVAGFVRWLPLLARLDGEVAGRARAEAEYQAALERSRRFNAGLEALGKAHMEEGWDRTTLCEETARRLSTLMGCDRVSIWRLEADGSALRCITLFDARSGGHEDGSRLERALNPAYFDAIESGAVVCVSDTLNDPVTRAFGPAYLEPLGIGAMLDAPICTGRGVHGVVCCEHVGPGRRWTPEEVSLASAAAQYVAVAYLADNAETLAAELKRALRDAEAASAAKSAFVANMSHELRTPLNGVLGMARALSDELTDPVQADKLDVIMRSGELLLGVLNDVLDLSKIEAGRMEIRPEPVQPGELIRQTCALFQAAAGQKGLDLSCRLEAMPERVEIDGVRLRQILSNLVANAVKFTEQGTVTVAARAEPEGDGWRLDIEVRDTGCGISADDQARLFERFSQVDDSHARRHSGAGLGLVIARELARRMEGDIRLESTPGEGSRFIVSLRAQAAAAERAPDYRVEAGDLAGLNVLLVDDNEVNRIVARCFVEPAGAIVTEAASGPDALALLDEQHFDLVLLDAHMPGMGGLEVLAEIRARPAIAGLPVIALTADALPGDEARYLQAGMDGYVSKPVDKARLLEACSRLANGRASVERSDARRA